jgi:spore coat polysaccharide biosynthesis protein SpsF
VKVVAIIQARMGSTRLPGKVLRRLGGSLVLAHVVQRVQAVSGVDEVVVATTSAAADDALAREAAALGASVYRGSEDDVLDRYHSAAAAASADIVIRVTSDCPLLDPLLVSSMLQRFLPATGPMQFDYMSNGLRRTFPRGLDAEIFTMAALVRAHKEARLPYEREHVTPYLYQHPDRFRVHSYEGDRDLSGYRWTLDTPEDFEMLTKIFEAFDGAPPGTSQVLAFLEKNPKVAQINSEVRQKALGE